MVKNRRRLTAAYKLQFALEGSRTLSPLSIEHGIHAKQMGPGDGRNWNTGPTFSANVYDLASKMRTSISTSMTRYVSCKPNYAYISTSTTMRDHIKVSTITRRPKSTSCSDGGRPHPSGCNLFFPFRGPSIGAHHNAQSYALCLPSEPATGRLPK